MFCSFKMRRKDIVSCAIVITLILSCFVSSLLYANASQTVSKSEVPLPILMYHSVCYNKVSSEYIITPEVFEQDLIYLKEHGYTSISAKELIDYAYNNVALPEKPVMITFDDGQMNNLTYVLPLLEKYDMKAIMSVVGVYSEKESNAKDRNPAYSCLSWDEIKALNESGRVDIGNHTYNMHEIGTRRGCMQKSGESDEYYKKVLNEDLSKLQSELNEKCGITPVAFAYPYGFISKNSVPVIKDMGFKMAFNCKEQINYISYGNTDSLYSLNRFNRPSGVNTSDFMTRNKIV